MPNVAAQTWGSVAATWQSRNRIGASFPLGTYTYCISARDAAGHRATSCAAYQIKA